jgi:hypothetical protein
VRDIDQEQAQRQIAILEMELAEATLKTEMSKKNKINDDKFL